VTTHTSVRGIDHNAEKRSGRRDFNHCDGNKEKKLLGKLHFSLCGVLIACNPFKTGSQHGGINNLKKKGANMGFWEQIGQKDRFRKRDDKGTHTVTKVFGGEKLLDQTKDNFRTIDSRKRIRIRDAETGKEKK
jgi:hypothetical protein